MSNINIYCELHADDRPGLTQLQQLQSRDGKPIKLLQVIGPHYSTFGTCLLADEDGTKMATIKSDHRTVEEKTREIFTKWLLGKIFFRAFNHIMQLIIAMWMYNGVWVI